MSRVYLFLLGLPKTLLFNFYYFSFWEACKLPVFVSHHVYLSKLSGSVVLESPVRGGIKIGYGDVGIFDRKRSRTIWRLSDQGEVHFKGKAHIGHGSKIGVLGKLVFGNNAVITAESTIVAHERITIGENVLISWDVLIIDTDFHYIYERNDLSKPLNNNKPIHIGNSVWIGCRAMVLKGVDIADGCVIGAGSTVSKGLLVSDSVYAGVPACLGKENIIWKQ